MGAAAAPMIIGSAIGAATSKNPLQGALLGGALGGFGGAVMPSLSSLGGAASSGVNPGILSNAASGSITSAVNPALVTSSLPTSAANVGFQTAAQQAAAQMPANIANEAAKSAGSGIFSGGIGSSQPGVVPSLVSQPFVSSGTSTGLIPSSMYEPTFMDRVGSVGQFAQNNPVLTNMAMQSAQGMLEQPQSLPPAGLMRGNPTQVQRPQYNVGVPQVSLI